MRPVNRVAARVVSSGEHFEPNKRITEGAVHSDVPLPLARVPRDAEDLTGRTLGKLTVLGPYAPRPSRWACRCVCGAYTIRTARAIRNPSNGQDACEHCRHLAFLQHRDLYRRTGRDAPVS